MVASDQLSFHDLSSLIALSKFKFCSILAWITGQEEGKKLWIVATFELDRKLSNALMVVLVG